MLGIWLLHLLTFASSLYVLTPALLIASGFLTVIVAVFRLGLFRKKKEASGVAMNGNPSDTSYSQINDLPIELREYIFLKSHPTDLASCRRVCHQWNNEIKGSRILMKRIWSTVKATKCIEMARNGNVDFVKAMIQWAKKYKPS